MAMDLLRVDGNCLFLGGHELKSYNCTGMGGYAFQPAHDHGIVRTAFSPRRKFLVSVDLSGTIKCWNLSEVPERRRQHVTSVPHHFLTVVLAVADDGHVCIGKENTVSVYSPPHYWNAPKAFKMPFNVTGFQWCEEGLVVSDVQGTEVLLERGENGWTPREAPPISTPSGESRQAP